MDTTWTIVPTGTWRHGIKVTDISYCPVIINPQTTHRPIERDEALLHIELSYHQFMDFMFAGNFAIPESMKREYGAS